jgi:hypothetical protein
MGKIGVVYYCFANIHGDLKKGLVGNAGAITSKS